VSDLELFDRELFDRDLGDRDLGDRDLGDPERCDPERCDQEQSWVRLPGADAGSVVLRWFFGAASSAVGWWFEHWFGGVDPTCPLPGSRSGPPQDVVVLSSPDPAGPQDAGELHQSNSTLVNGFFQTSVKSGISRESGALRRRRQVGLVTRDPRPRSRPANPDRQNVAPPSVAHVAALHPSPP
jgi:hypothetical protein